MVTKRSSSPFRMNDSYGIKWIRNYYNSDWFRNKMPQSTQYIYPIIIIKSAKQWTICLFIQNPATNKYDF